jgi:oligopeptide/dipeptide ABC transporter ATP-binding protein
MRLLESTAGTVTFEGEDITKTSQRNLRPFRRQMQMVFQDPYASLNPRQTVGTIIGAPYRIHRTEGDSKRRVQELMDRVGLNPEHYNRYPHEFSGGQRQRIGVARALALSPKLIVCDEPVSALDVSIQAQILNLLQGLQEDFNLTYLFISHDLGVVRHISDRIAVMYLGHIVEYGSADTILDDPKHPYTAALLSAVPKGYGHEGDIKTRIVLQGDDPSPVDPPSGCPFHPRCPKARLVSGSPETVPENCREEFPPLGEAGSNRRVACWYPLQEGDELERMTPA